MAQVNFLSTRTACCKSGPNGFSASALACFWPSKTQPQTDSGHALDAIWGVIGLAIRHFWPFGFSLLCCPGLARQTATPASLMLLLLLLLLLAGLHCHPRGRHSQLDMQRFAVLDWQNQAAGAHGTMVECGTRCGRWCCDLRAV